MSTKRKKRRKRVKRVTSTANTQATTTTDTNSVELHHAKLDVWQNGTTEIRDALAMLSTNAW